MDNFEKITGLIELSELSMDANELDENGGATPTVVLSFVSGAVTSALVSAILPTTACSSKCK